MDSMPTDRGLDSTLALLADGYTFISKRCDRYGSDVFATRLLLEPTICVRGEQAAQVFYDTARFTRVEAAPGRLSKTLFGEGGVQALDGAAHRHRKALFMSLMTPERIARLVALTDAAWRDAVARWRSLLPFRGGARAARVPVARPPVPGGDPRAARSLRHQS